MSNLLLPEPPLVLLPSLAVTLGLNEAIILQQLHYWLVHKQADRDKYADSFREDRWWVYNTVEEWREQFPFWSEDTVQRGLASLKKRGVVLVKALARDPRDRTNWYTIDYERVEGIAAPARDKRQCNQAECDTASPQPAAMGSPQPAAVHQRKMPQSLSEITAENSQKLQQQNASLPPEPLPSPHGRADVVVKDVEVQREEQEQERLTSCAPGTDIHDPVQVTSNENISEESDRASSPPAFRLEVIDLTRSCEETLLAELVSEGMGEKQARNAVAEKYDVAEMQLENLRRALPGDKILPSRGGWLYKAITTGYGHTKGYAQFLETQKAERERREALTRDDAARQSQVDSERILFDKFEADLSSEEYAALRQRARNCIHPDFRKRGEAKCALMISENYKSLLRGDELTEHCFWAENSAAESNDDTQNGRSSGPEE